MKKAYRTIVLVASLWAGIASAAGFVPIDGLWWNTAESGSGYMLGSRHGVMVMTTYSYTQAGAPLWYISIGPIANSTFSATLEKAINGQCISCSYRNPISGGNDGIVTIVFTSATTGLMTLAGRGTFPIQLQEF
jgi:hypothetical protein